MATVPTDNWSELTPDGGDSIQDGDNKIRQLKTQVRQVLAQDHNFGTVDTAPVGTSAQWGYHNKLTFYEQSADPTDTTTDIIQVYSKADSSTTYTELFMRYTAASTNIVQLTKSGILYGEGGFTVAAATKLCLDGLLPSSSETYIYESADNYLDLVAGGVNYLRVMHDGANPRVYVNAAQLLLYSGKSLILNSSERNYIVADVSGRADTTDFYAAGSLQVAIGNGIVHCYTAHIELERQYRIYFDAGSDDYITSNTNNELDFVVGGVEAFRVSNTIDCNKPTTCSTTLTVGTDFRVNGSNWYKQVHGAQGSDDWRFGSISKNVFVYTPSDGYLDNIVTTWIKISLPGVDGAFGGQTAEAWIPVWIKSYS